MSSKIFPAYKHSGNFQIHGLLLVIASSIIFGATFGLAYVYLLKWIPIVYFNVLLTAGYGFAAGFVCGWILQYGRVRNQSVTLMCGIFAGLVAWYMQWNFHVASLVKALPMWNSHEVIFQMMQTLYEHGSWSLGRRSPEAVTGIPLALVWAVEALIIVGMCAMAAYGIIAKTPFCETSRCWLDEETKISTLAPFLDPQEKENLKNGNLEPLIPGRPKVAGSDHFARITLRSSKKGLHFFTMEIENISTETDKNGKTTEKCEALTPQLVIPVSMLELIKGFEKLEFKPQALPA